MSELQRVYGPVLHISDEQGNSLILDRTARDGVFLDIVDVEGSRDTLFWLTSDRIPILIDVLRKFQ